MLQSWLANPAHASEAASVRAPIDVLYRHWIGVDRGLLSDSDEVCGAYLELEVAEKYAIERGYPVPVGHGRISTESCSVGAAREAVDSIPVVGAVALAASDYCDKNPYEPACALTSPMPVVGDGAPSACARLSLPSVVCEPWFGWALGAAGLVIAGGVAVVAVKAARAAAPFALAAYAPGMMPFVGSVPPHVRKLVDTERAVGSLK